MTFLLALTVFAGTGTQGRDIGQQVYSRVADSVLLAIIENKRGETLGRGSAFAIAAGRLITNAHVAKEGKFFVKGGAFEGRAAAPSPQAKPPAKTIPAVMAALEQSRFRYRKSMDGVWWITFKGDNLDSLEVMIQALDEMVVVAATVKKNPGLTVETMKGLLRASFDASFSKLALDENGSVVALTELPADFTASDLKGAINGVATLADKAAARLAASSAGPEGESPTRVAAGRGATLSILRGAFELSYDPAKWKVKSTDAGVTELGHVSGDASVKVISERLEIPRESFRAIVIENAKGVAPDMRVISETPRVVNGLNVVLLRYGGTAQGIKFTFYNQMYSDASGTIQLAAWTGTNLFDEYERDFLELFAGLVRVR